MIAALFMFASLVVVCLATITFSAWRRHVTNRRTLDAFVKSIADDLRAMPPDTHVAATGGGLAMTSPFGENAVAVDPSPEPSCCGACSGCQSCSCPSKVT